MRGYELKATRAGTVIRLEFDITHMEGIWKLRDAFKQAGFLSLQCDMEEIIQSKQDDNGVILESKSVEL